MHLLCQMPSRRQSRGVTEKPKRNISPLWTQKFIALPFYSTRIFIAFMIVTALLSPPCPPSLRRRRPTSPNVTTPSPTGTRLCRTYWRICSHSFLVVFRRAFVIYSSIWRSSGRTRSKPPPYPKPWSPLQRHWPKTVGPSEKWSAPYTTKTSNVCALISIECRPCCRPYK